MLEKWLVFWSMITFFLFHEKGGRGFLGCKAELISYLTEINLLTAIAMVFTCAVVL